MNDNIKVEESFIASLVKNAAWDAARVSLVEKKDSGEKKGDEGAGKKKKDKPDFTTDARKGDKSKTDPGEEDYEKASKGCPTDEMYEEVDEHMCPLCESVLDEALTDDQVVEHISKIQDALMSIEEEDEGLDEEYEEDEDTSRQRTMDKVESLKNQASEG